MKEYIVDDSEPWITLTATAPDPDVVCVRSVEDLEAGTAATCRTKRCTLVNELAAICV